MPDFTILIGDALEQLRTLPESSVDCVITSPPYWGLRDYGHAGQIGLEETPEAFVAALVEVFREVRRVLKPEGTLWMNLGDSYATGTTAGRNPTRTAGEHVPASWSNRCDSTRIGTPAGLKTKDLVGIPWRVAFALQSDGWYLRQDIIWHKPNPMPESVTDRCTKAHEYIFLMSKSGRYFYDHEAVREPIQSDRAPSRKAKASGAGHVELRSSGTPYDGTGTTRNRRSVWCIATQPTSEAHFATFPEDLVEPCLLAGCPEGGTVLDPFTGSGTTGAVALRHHRRFVGIELNPAYAAMATRRIEAAVPGPSLFLNAEASA